MAESVVATAEDASMAETARENCRGKGRSDGKSEVAVTEVVVRSDDKKSVAGNGYGDRSATVNQWWPVVEAVE